MRIKTALSILAMLLFSGCGDSGSAPLAGDIESLRIEANASSLYATQTLQLEAFATYSHDIDERNVTENVEWYTSDSSIAAVSADGLVSGTEYGGVVEITADYDHTFNDSVSLYVYGLESIQIDANETNLTQEQTLQLQATGTFEDSSVMDVTDAVLWVLDKRDDNNASLEQNGTLYTGDANGTLEVIVYRYDLNATLMVEVLP